MGKKSRHAVNTEFPLLDELNLYASTTEGDGNCLFRALSDQVFGDESHHAEIRGNVVAYVEKHGDHFAAFVGEYGETFEQYIQRLYQDGVYGGHIEIVGFAEYYRRQVAVYQADNMYILEPQGVKPSEWSGTAHLAYHTWEHYSSVRPKAGPHSGPVAFPVPEALGPARERANADASQDSAIPPWKIEIVLRSVPDAPESQIVQMLQTKDLDTVIEELLLQQYDEPHDARDEPAGLESSSGAAAAAALDEQAPEPSRAAEEGVDAKAKKKGEAKKVGRERSDSAAKAGSKKQQAKDRRQEKKDRARRKKTQQLGVRQSEDSQGESAPHDISNRVIHI